MRPVIGGHGFQVEVLEREVRREAWPAAERITELDVAAADMTVKDICLEIAIEAHDAVAIRHTGNAAAQDAAEGRPAERLAEFAEADRFDAAGEPELHGGQAEIGDLQRRHADRAVEDRQPRGFE
jgi:hypothetical protein